MALPSPSWFGGCPPRCAAPERQKGGGPRPLGVIGVPERGLWEIFRSTDAVDYLEGEEPPGR